MTLIAGAFAIDPRATIDTERRKELVQAMGVLHAGDLQRHEWERGFLVKWDSGAFGESAWHVGPDSSVSALVGDPLLLESGNRVSRSRQLQQLLTADGCFLPEALARTRGSFSAVSYSPGIGSLQIATDALGIRTTYFSVQDDVLVFSSALRVLESLPWLRRRLSSVGMAEIGTFEFPLGCRTPYEEIQVLREAQMLTATGKGVEFFQYYDWGETRDSDARPEDAATRIHGVFREAIRVRADRDRRAYAFLSGGMDSRAIVSTLIATGQHVEAMNFSLDHSQDLRFAQLMAEAAGPDACRLHCLGGGGEALNFSLLALAAKEALESRTNTGVDRPAMIWSGDGGSVGLGHAYMNEAMLDIAEAGDIEAAMRHFLRFNKYSPSLRTMTPEAQRNLGSRVFASVMEEVQRYPRCDAGRRIYLFLIFNDQRRHLFKHFESIHRHGLELLTPFYDTALIQAVSDTPSRWGILHRQYALLFRHLPTFALETPWQTYPGHVPCPVPWKEDLSYQWRGTKKLGSESLSERWRLARKVLEAFDGRIEPAVFSRWRVLLASVLHFMGIRDCRHLLGVLETYRTYQSRTGPG